MAMPQQDDYIEQIHRLEANRPLRGFATHREANTPSEASAEGSVRRSQEPRVMGPGVMGQESWGRSWSLELELENGG